MQADFDRELQSYFTDVEHLRKLFKDWLAAPELPKRMLIIHGVGGVGKSSLLRMFRLHARSARIPVALASGDEQKSALDVLSRWADDLVACDVRLSAFSKALAQYRALLIKVEDEAAKTATTLAKEAAKTAAEVALGLIPGFGPALSRLGGMSAEALTDWLFSRGFKKPDVDLFLDPAKKLTGDFLADVAKAAGRRRLVLMLDTFEQIAALSDWTCRVAQQLPPNVLLVIAGRVVPDWDRAWPGWMAGARVEELKPMTEANIRELVRRYYATLCGGEPDPKQVEAIIAFARGLPMVVTSAVQLWIRYPETVGDFQAVKPYVVADLVDRLMEGVPKELVPALEAAAIVRWFDQPILRAVMEREDVQKEYEELRRFPFVRPRAEGFAFHDAVREIVDENLRVHDAERHRALHERAAAYLEARLERATGAEAERLALERLYHRIRGDEETGIQLFQEMAEELARYRLVNRLRALLNDVNTYPLERENSRLWREYYNTKLRQLERRFTETESSYEQIAKKAASVDAKLQRKATLSQLEVLSVVELAFQHEGLYRAFKVCKECENLVLKTDPDWAWVLIRRGTLYLRRAGYLNQAEKDLRTAIEICQQQGDLYGLVVAYTELKSGYVDEGAWKEVLNIEQEALNRLPPDASPLLRARILGHWKSAWAFMGRFKEGEQDAWEVHEINRQFGIEIEDGGASRNLLLLIGMQSRFREVDDRFSIKVNYYKRFDPYPYGHGGLGWSLGFWGMAEFQGGEIEKAKTHFLDALAVSREAALDQDMCWLYWLGTCHIATNEWQDAERHFSECINLPAKTQRKFSKVGLTFTAALPQVSPASNTHRVTTLPSHRCWQKQSNWPTNTNTTITWPRCGSPRGTSPGRATLPRGRTVLMPHCATTNRHSSTPCATTASCWTRC